MEEKMAEKVDKTEKKSRVPMPEQDPKVRARNFIEVPTGYTVKMAQEEAARCLQCKKNRVVSPAVRLAWIFLVLSISSLKEI